jgi:hypothetical protein
MKGLGLSYDWSRMVGTTSQITTNGTMDYSFNVWKKALHIENFSW